jgi:hypothetical protein
VRERVEPDAFEGDPGECESAPQDPDDFLGTVRAFLHTPPAPKKRKKAKSMASKPVSIQRLH